MLLDSNIIYSFLPEFQELRIFFSHHDISCSVISSVDFDWIEGLKVVNPLA